MKEWAEVMGEAADDTFVSLTEDLLDDWGESWRLTSSSVDDYVLRRVTTSSIWEKSGPDESPGRWLADHYKSRSWNCEWTERSWGYFVNFALKGKLDKASAIWSKLHEQKLQSAMIKAKKARADEEAELEVAIANPVKLKKKLAKKPARLAFLCSSCEHGEYYLCDRNA